MIYIFLCGYDKNMNESYRILYRLAYPLLRFLALCQDYGLWLRACGLCVCAGTSTLELKVSTIPARASGARGERGPVKPGLLCT